jgi:UDP-N-acetylmuramoyl-tripeptide--D-alanyl-D-alanine ligase
MKNVNLTIEDLFNIPTAVIYNPDNYKNVTSVSIDSRVIKKNSLFVAIKGYRFDGHNFIKDAVKKGASAVVINEKNYRKHNSLEIPIITVKDTTLALGDLAKTWRKKLRTKIIGITGSAGKTTTKEMLSALLKEKYTVNKTIGNNNNHIGVPLTLFSTNNKHDFLVLELGTNHFGEIAYTSGIAQPNYALITNIGSSHLEFLKNKEGVLKEKIALFNSTISQNGILFINNEDRLLNNCIKNYPKILSFGFQKDSDIIGNIDSYTNDGRPVIEVVYKNKTIAQTFPLYGEQNAKNYLAAASIALKLGLNKKQILNGTSKFKPVDKRLNVKRFKNFILIDDTYNANPESMRHAFELLPNIKLFNRKILILGDMFELGEQSKKLHEQLAAHIRKNKIDSVYMIGKFMKYLNASLNKYKINNLYFETRQELKKYLIRLDLSNSVILVKGSRGMRMEEFVKIIESRVID